MKQKGGSYLDTMVVRLGHGRDISEMGEQWKGYNLRGVWDGTVKEGISKCRDNEESKSPT